MCKTSHVTRINFTSHPEFGYHNANAIFQLNIIKPIFDKRKVLDSFLSTSKIGEAQTRR